MRKKIKTYDELIETIAPLKAEKKTIVHCHGVYDLLHIGHIKHLKAAKELGDILVVTITPNQYVNKGPHRPVFGEQLRAEALASLSCVNFVAVNNYPTAVEIITDLRPDIYVKGVAQTDGKRDHTDAIILEEKAVNKVGGKLVLTDEETYSASHLINRFMDIFTPEAKIFLEDFRGKYSHKKIVGWLQALRPLKVLTIGDTILDEYVFCDALGKANKEAVLVVGHNYTETYAGGILAIANHISGFCDNVGLISATGALDSRRDFIDAKMFKNIDCHFVQKPDDPTMIKRRYVEEYLQTKLFEVYNTNNGAVKDKTEKELLAILGNALPNYDVVIVADYGHGLLTQAAIDLICKEAKFLAVNTQTNAGNMGFNHISKYSRADFIAIAGPELRLDNRNLDANLQSLMIDTAEKLSCSRMIITQGKSGCLCYDREDGFLKIPAFSVRMVDRIGSGDALLALTAPCAAMGLPLDVIGFIGDVAGAEACAIMGNKTSVEPSSFYRHITSLLQ